MEGKCEVGGNTTEQTRLQQNKSHAKIYIACTLQKNYHIDSFITYLLKDESDEV
jgi:hypothetical protein